MFVDFIRFMLIVSLIIKTSVMDVLKIIEKQKLYYLNLGQIGKLLKLREFEKALMENITKDKINYPQ
jgi:hypothetical protein